MPPTAQPQACSSAATSDCTPSTKMKQLFLIILLTLFSVSVWGQSGDAPRKKAVVNIRPPIGFWTFQTNPPLTIQEIDGSPKRTNVTVLKVSNGSISCSGSISTLTTSGRDGTTINPTNGTIPYRSNSTTFADSPLLRTDADTIQLLGSANSRLQIKRILGQSVNMLEVLSHLGVAQWSI